jgi:hypothetical protein
MHPEIENLINMALADGEVTEKERGIIMRKAESLGLDIDEVEMILNGQIALSKKQNHNSLSSKATSTKEGEIKKCPACGAIVQSFSTKCSDCSHEFRNTVTTSSIQKLFEMLNELEGTRNESTALGGLNNVFGQAFGLKNKTESRKQELISNFPVPNTKEDILEFLSLALPKTKKMGFFGADGYTRKAHNEMADIWIGKCHQIIMKARFSMKDDKKTLEEIEYYAKQIGIK